jgi:hypothetical protein
VDGLHAVKLGVDPVEVVERVVERKAVGPDDPGRDERRDLCPVHARPHDLRLKKKKKKKKKKSPFLTLPGDAKTELPNKSCGGLVSW